MINIKEIVREAIVRTPAVSSYLPPALLRSVFSEIKTLEYFQTNIDHLVKSVYGGHMGGDFVDIMGNLITGQMADAYRRAWVDNDGTGNLPEYLQTSLDEFVAQNINFDWIYQYYKDIVDARIDGTSIEPLLARAQMWANRYREATAEAVRLITAENGGKLIWIFGDAEHCETCQSLNGIVAFATEWQTSGFKPQAAPNPLLICGGWRCKCKLEKTDKRRSPKALDTLINIATGQNL